MCRFVVYWGKKSVNLSDWILSADNCLLQQSRQDMSQRPNPDGWGFAYRNGSDIKLIKRPKPAFEDKEYQAAARKIVSDLLFAHVRRQSQGDICSENTHPFVRDNWMFMHNGNIPNLPHYKKQLGTKLAQHLAGDIKGTTDSEFFFQYFMYWLKKSRDCDIYCILNLVYSVIHGVIELTEPQNRNQLALNFVLSNGEFIIGFRRNRSLFYSRLDDALVIASEKINHRLEWNEVPENHFIVALRPADIRLAAYDIELKKQLISNS